MRGTMRIWGVRSSPTVVAKVVTLELKGKSIAQSQTGLTANGEQRGDCFLGLPAAGSREEEGRD